MYQPFLGKISGEFLCLIFAVLYHNLQAYETGEYVVPPVFCYENSSGELWILRSLALTLMIQAVTFTRLLNQWNQFPTTLQENLLQVIRNDLVKKSKKSGKVLRLEQKTAYVVDKTHL